MNKWCIRQWCLGCLLLIAGSSWAASPWYIDAKGSGKPYIWPNGKIVWYSEKSGLGPLTESDVLQVVQLAFDTWATAGLTLPGLVKVRTAAVQAEHGGVVTEPITKVDTIENYLALRKTLVVMDDDGSFTEALGGDPDRVAAITFLGSAMDNQKVQIQAGFTVLNGGFLKNVKQFSLDDPQVKMFLATVIHEFGHLYNLDHSAVNDDLFSDVLNDPKLSQALPTMYPIIATPDQASLHSDDIVAISNLYPTAELKTKFCEIAGTLVGSDGRGFQGAQVVARSETDPYLVAISAITGNYFPQDTADGSYVLRGILPGIAYAVSYEELNPNFIGASSIQPYGDQVGEKPRAGFGTGQITGGNGKAMKVLCQKGGESLLMDTIQLGIPAGGATPAASLVEPTAPINTADGTGSSKSGGCSLLPNRH